MNRLLAVSMTAALAFSPAAFPHEEGTVGKLGKVEFANSCNAAAQADLARAVAILHSFWFSAGEGAFRAVLDKDPSCAIATWGIASIAFW